MSKTDEISIGAKFGLFTVTGPLIHRDSHVGKTYECTCACGKKSYLSHRNLTTAERWNSCRQCERFSRMINRGRISAYFILRSDQLQYDETSKTWVASVTCRKCGQDAEVRPGELGRDGRNNCGCVASGLSSTKPSPRRRWPGLINGHLWRYLQHKATCKGIAFEITPEQAWEAFLKTNGICPLSSRPIHIGRRVSDRTASLDRIDSSDGYILGNVRWIHRIANNQKALMSDQEYIAFCRSVVETADRKETPPEMKLAA